MDTTTTQDIERLYLDRGAAFRRTLAHVTGSVEAGDDALQEGFARALVNLPQFRGDGSLEAWVWRICLNEARDTRRRPSTLALDDAPNVAAAPSIERDPDLAAAVRGLPPRRRLVVFLRYFADLSYDEIAAATGIRPGTVAATLGKAREALLTALETKEAVR